MEPAELVVIEPLVRLTGPSTCTLLTEFAPVKFKLKALVESAPAKWYAPLLRVEVPPTFMMDPLPSVQNWALEPPGVAKLQLKVTVLPAATDKMSLLGM